MAQAAGTVLTVILTWAPTSLIRDRSKLWRANCPVGRTAG